MDYSKLDEISQIDYLNRLDEAFAKVPDMVSEPPESKVHQLIKFMSAYRDGWNNLHLFDKSYLKHFNNVISIAQKCQNIEILKAAKDSQDITIINPNLILSIAKDIFNVPQLIMADTVRGCFTKKECDDLIKIISPDDYNY